MVKVVVIGAVAAGMSTAAKLKRLMGKEVEIVVFEKGDVVSYAACGIPYYVSGHVADATQLYERRVEDFQKSGIDVRLHHEVTSVDTSAKTVTVRKGPSGETLTEQYDKLVVASGARVRKIPPLDARHDNLFVVRTVDDGVRLRKALEDKAAHHVVVVGAGYIGLEIAEACAKQGKAVLVVEFAERILPVMDPEATDQLHAELERHRVQIRTSSKVVKLETNGNRVVGVVVENAHGRDLVPAEVVVNSAGIVPNAEFIDVRKTMNGAIIVNEKMETSIPDVYAAGDCSVMTGAITGEHQYAPLGTNANKQGRIIAHAIAGQPTPRICLLGSSAIRLFGLDAAKIGLSEIDAQRLNLDYEANYIIGNGNPGYWSSDKVSVKLVYERKSRKILGAQVVGKGVVAARANYYAIAITAGMTVDEFGYLDLAYSPPFSGVWDVTLIAANTAK